MRAKGVLVFALLFAAAAHGAAAQSLTLRAAVDEALLRNPSIAAASARKQVAAAREGVARGARLPRVDFSESATRGNNPVFVFGSLLEQGEFAARHFDPAFLNAPNALTNFRASLTARYAMFDRFRAAEGIRQSRHAIDHADVELEDSQQRVRSQAVARFYGVIVAEAKVVTAKEAVVAADADAKATRDRFDQGLLVESDALSADVQLASFRRRLIAAESDLAIARAALATLLQRPQGDSMALTGTLPTVSSDEPDLDGTVARAVARGPSVRIASIRTADAISRLRMERGAALPRVDTFATIGASGSTVGRRNSDHTGGVAITLDLFDRARPGRIGAARAEIEESRAGEAIARDAVTMEVVAAWHRQRAARETVTVASAAVEQAQAAARIVRDRYEQGLITINEHLRAQTEFVSARFELLAAQYESVAARAELLRATGDLDDVQPFI